MNLPKEEIEEILEGIWVAREENRDSVGAIGEHLDGEPDEVLGHLEKEGFISIDDGRIRLLSSGEGIAQRTIRRHRLAERLMVDILGMEEKAIEKTACEFEHALSDGVEETICTLLGHPRKCPHGADIPVGKCCREAKKQIENIITTLDNVEVGREVKVVYISTDQHDVLHKLTSYGIIPGTVISVHQKSPTMVIQTENLQLALDREIGKDITVRKFW